MMCKKVICWFILVLSAMFIVSCSEDDKQNEKEVEKGLLVGSWESQSVEGSYTGEYRECFDFRDDGTFTVYDYENGEGWYDDGVGVWVYNNNNLTLTYSDQLDVFGVKSITENELVLVKPDSDGSTISVKYHRIASVQVSSPDTKKTLVGVWSGEIGYSCSNGKHIPETGMIIFENDGTGALKYTGEDADSFRYELDEANKQIIVRFDDNRRGVFQYSELSKTHLILVEQCANCGKKVNMQLERAN